MTATTIEREPEVVTQGLGGQPTTGEPTPKPKAEPKPQPEPRYAEGMDELSGKVLAAREQVGRKVLAEFADQSQSAIWRWERSRVHPTEADAIKALVQRIEAGELPVPEPKTKSKTDRLLAIVETAAADKKVTKAQLIAELRDVLAPKA
jgi:hypothetical protein